MNDKFKIFAPGWFGWQMNPGYGGQRCVPYFSPIHVTRVAPLKTGKGILEIDFWNVCYAEGVQNFEGVRLKILLRAENYLIGLLLDSSSKSAKCRNQSHRVCMAEQLLSALSSRLIFLSSNERRSTLEVCRCI